MKRRKGEETATRGQTRPDGRPVEGARYMRQGAMRPVCYKCYSMDNKLGDEDKGKQGEDKMVRFDLK